MKRIELASLESSVSALPVAGILVRTLLKANRDRSKDMAASIAFFSFFSLFPLGLGIVAGASYFVDETEIQQRLTQLLFDALPGGLDFATENVSALFRLRRAVGLLSIVGLLWSASKMFGALSRGVNGALGLKWKRSVLLSPLRRVLMAIIVSVLVFLVASASAFLEVTVKLDLGLVSGNMRSWLTFAGGHVSGYLSVVAVLIVLYRLVPFQRPKWRELLPGALFAALLIELGKLVFVVYVEKISQLEAVYGSLSSVIVFLLWMYFSARVILLGVEFIAVRREDAVDGRADAPRST